MSVLIPLKDAASQFVERGRGGRLDPPSRSSILGVYLSSILLWQSWPDCPFIVLSEVNKNHPRRVLLLAGDVSTT